MNTIAILLSSRTGWLSIGTTVFAVLTYVLPLLPQPWGGLVSAVLAVLTYYHIGKSVDGARLQGVKGI